MYGKTEYTVIRLIIAALAVLACTAASGQQPVPHVPPTRVTTSQEDAFVQHLEAARESAGTEWLGVVDHMCTRGRSSRQPGRPLIDPCRFR